MDRGSWTLSRSERPTPTMTRWTILVSALVLALAPDLAAKSPAGEFKRREFQRDYQGILERYSIRDADAFRDLVRAETAVAGTGDLGSVDSMRSMSLRSSSSTT